MTNTAQNWSICKQDNGLSHEIPPATTRALTGSQPGARVTKYPGTKSSIAMLADLPASKKVGSWNLDSPPYRPQGIAPLPTPCNALGRLFHPTTPCVGRNNRRALRRCQRRCNALCLLHPTTTLPPPPLPGRFDLVKTKNRDEPGFSLSYVWCRRPDSTTLPGARRDAATAAPAGRRPGMACVSRHGNRAGSTRQKRKTGMNPVFRYRMYGAEGRTRTGTACATTPSR